MDFQDNDNNTQELMAIFQTESEEILDRIFESLTSLEKKPSDKAITSALYRDLHSIKGAVRMVGFENIQNIIHKIEDIFDIVNTENVVLDKETIGLIEKSMELVSRYLQESVKNEREIIDDLYTPTLSSIELCVSELTNNSENSYDPVASLAAIAENPSAAAVMPAEVAQAEP